VVGALSSFFSPDSNFKFFPVKIENALLSVQNWHRNGLYYCTTRTILHCVLAMWIMCDPLGQIVTRKTSWKVGIKWSTTGEMITAQIIQRHLWVLCSHYIF